MVNVIFVTLCYSGVTRKDEIGIFAQSASQVAAGCWGCCWAMGCPGWLAGRAKNQFCVGWVDMENYITLQAAATRLGVEITILIELVSLNRISAIKLENGVIAVKETELINFVKKEDRADYQALAGLAGVEIGISEAARKYKIPQQTVSRWAARQWLKVLGHQGRKTLIDEQDIAWYAAQYKAMQGGQGKWIFTKTGIPYQKNKP